jgi:hypothetical protein
MFIFNIYKNICNPEIFNTLVILSECEGSHEILRAKSSQNDKNVIHSNDKVALLNDKKRLLF